MPLFEIGYRRYEGARTSHAMRWLPITRAGLSIAWRSKLLRRLVIASFLPLLYFGWLFFVIGRITDPGTDPSGPFYELAREFVGERLVTQLHEDPSVVRSGVWTVLFSQFSTTFQLLLAGLVAAVAGPPLISNDLRTRAFLIYFARPVSRLDYVLGKMCVLGSVLAAVTLLPCLTLYVLSVLFSPSLGTITQTLPVALAIVGATLGTIVPVSLVVLLLSSLTIQPRYVAITWFVICLFGPLTHVILQETRGFSGNEWTFLISLPHTVQAFQLGVYDVQGHALQLAQLGDFGDLVEGMTSSHSSLRAGVWLAILSVVSVLVLLRRVDSPTRI